MRSAVNNVYERLRHEVITPGLCTGCGTCVSLANGRLMMIESDNGPLPVPAGSSTVDLPDAAWHACPGKGWDVPNLNQYVFGAQPENWLMGCVHSLYIGYATNEVIRRGGASGGVLTQTLLYLLAQHQIDGAIAVQQGTPQPWQASPVIARTPDAIKRCSQSVYRPVPVNMALAQATAFTGRLAYVGLPDQVASLRRLQQLGDPVARTITTVLGPYTGTNMLFGAVASFLRSHGVYDLTDITRLRYREGEWPGYLHIELRDGRTLTAEKFYYNYLIPFYVTPTTLTAVDFTNELTDISVGDAWSPRYEVQGEGFSVIVARSVHGNRILRAMHDAGLLELRPLSIEEALAMHGHMLDFKKRGGFIRNDWRRARGRPAPVYGYRPRHIPLARKLVEVVVIGLFAVCRTRLARWGVERVPLPLIGPMFDKLRRAWKRMSRPVKRHGLGQYQVVLDQ